MIEQAEVSLPHIISAGVKARRIERTRDIAKRARRILYFIDLLSWFCL